MRASELSESVELRQNKYLNNLALAGPSVYQAIDQTRHGIPLFQYSTTNLKRIRGDEHVKERTGGRSRKGDVLARTEFVSQIFGVVA